jgi:predicted small lipoprotein YifL
MSRAAPAALLIVLAGCGQKGPPLPPLRPVPAALGDLRAERTADRITLQFTIPAANRDGSTPAAIDRVEIHAMTVPETTPLTREQLLDGKNLVATIQVRPADATTKPEAPPDTRPAPGAAASHVEQRRTDLETPGMVRHYIAAGYAGRRRGAETAMVSVPLSRAVPTTGPLTFTNDETTLKITWQPPAANVAFRVYEVPSGGGASTLLNAQPLTSSEITTPVAFGRERCFAVRTLEVTARVTLEGVLGATSCVTSTDTYAPAAPTKLVATPAEGAVELIWSESESSDVAGYLVLRGDSPNAILQQLSKEPVTEAKFRDATARSGVTYTYSVIAVDKSGNRSEQSNRQEVTAR